MKTNKFVKVDVWGWEEFFRGGDAVAFPAGTSREEVEKYINNHVVPGNLKRDSVTMNPMSIKANKIKWAKGYEPKS